MSGTDSRPEQIRRVADASLRQLGNRRDRPVLPAPRGPDLLPIRVVAGTVGELILISPPGRSVRSCPGRRRHHPPRACRPTGHRGARQCTSFGPATPSPKFSRRARNSASGLFQPPLGGAFSPEPSPSAEFADGDVPEHHSAIRGRQHRRQCGAAGRIRALATGRNAARSDRTGLAAGPTTLDRARSGNPASGPDRRERQRHRRGVIRR